MLTLKKPIFDVRRFNPELASHQAAWADTVAAHRERHTLYNLVEADAAAACRPPKRRVLDLGCGTGEFLDIFEIRYRAHLRALPDFPDRGDHVRCTGVDINTEVLHRARRFQREGRDLNFQWTDGVHLPAPDNAYQHCFAHRVLEQLDNPAWTLGEVRRVLVPGGTLSLVVPNRYGWGRTPDPAALRAWTARGLYNLLRGARFRVRRWQRMNRRGQLCRHWFAAYQVVLAESTKEAPCLA